MPVETSLYHFFAQPEASEPSPLGAATRMATAQHPSTPTLRPGVQPLRAGKGTSFLWRKLHSLLGIIPIGAFLVEHLLSNFEATKGALAYGEQVKFLNSLPMVRVLEWVFIFLPLALSRPLRHLHLAARANPTSSTTPGPATGCTSPSATPASSRCSTSATMSPAQRFMGVSLPENPYYAFAKVHNELTHPLILAVYIIAMIAVCWALRLRCLALRRQVGHHPGEVAASASAMSASPSASCSPASVSSASSPSSDPARPHRPRNCTRSN